MFKYNIDFAEICELISKWKWSELEIGLSKGIISKDDIISYAWLILEENLEGFDRVLELSIANEDEVENILKNMVMGEVKQDIEQIYQKWMFAIIYDAYTFSREKVDNIIEDIYTEFNYPEEISVLVGYMPCESTKTREERLYEYIETGKKTWC